MKLNLGSGSLKLEDYDNIDIKDGRSAYPLDVPDESCEVIRASHLLEHFGAGEVYDVISHWHSKLKVGGVLMVAVPDFSKIAKAYVDKTEHYNVTGYLMGGQTDKDDFHKSIFDRDSLEQLMISAGFDEICEWKSTEKDCAALPVSLNLCGKKVAKSNTVKRTLQAIISMPRLCFADNMNCIMTEIVSRGIPLKKGTGVFWSQCLTRMMEDVAKDKPDYILTLDYDSWFRFSHIEQLLALMEKHPYIDALCPVQMKRESDCPLMGLAGPDGKPLKTIDHTELEKDVLPILTGHFGLTVFRTSSLEKLKKPWFLGQPGPDGGWGEGRTDDDIYFWRNFAASGLKAAIANKVNIGHLQLVCTFPGHYTENFKCKNVPLGDIGKVDCVPEHCK